MWAGLLRPQVREGGAGRAADGRGADRPGRVLRCSAARGSERSAVPLLQVVSRSPVVELAILLERWELGIISAGSTEPFSLPQFGTIQAAQYEA